MKCSDLLLENIAGDWVALGRFIYNDQEDNLKTCFLLAKKTVMLYLIF